MSFASVEPVYPANWEAACKSIGDASSERVHAPKSFACSGKKYETKCDVCFPIVDLIEKKHQLPCSVNGHKYTSTTIDGTNTLFYDCLDCNQCGSELSQNCSVVVNNPVSAEPVKPANQPDLPPCCVHPHIGASEVEKSSENKLLDALDDAGRAEVQRMIKEEKERRGAEKRKAQIDAAFKLQLQIDDSNDHFANKCREIDVVWERKQAELVKIRDKKIDMAKADFELNRQRNDNERDVALKNVADAKVKANAEANADACKLSRD